ncbi:GNAT family N-acetyltransferase [Vagococcus xieshaowenii]|uniref:GNAT family N-acetyltransferase n=1 Tax=Vagococcus xieshaowenii TaxID=2562451 RepID=A0A4Z0DCS7_9ENTE|nr:GNAT family N-acetyltransferase [Vagococcus xieshaowenii]QCA28500.1 GNAT family N-acetyltransferase [Vagococcus xieshaowenii]TFZ42745.1 GNAT family N-acetyltransferase [Vagococcus xieshaowenii]
MEIRQANHGEFNHILQLLKQAATRIKNTGSTQWAHVLEGKEDQQLLTHLLNQEVMVGIMDNEIISVCYLTKRMSDWDCNLWGNRSTPHDFPTYYLHKLALADGYQGKGKADTFLLSLQKHMKQKYPEGSTIRLDCMAEKNILMDLYERVGFEFVARRDNIQLSDHTAPFNIYHWCSHVVNEEINSQS